MNNEYFRSERLLYRPLNLEELAVLMRFRNEKTYRHWFYFQDPPTIDALQEEFKARDVQKHNLLKAPFNAGIFLIGTGELVGSVSLNKFHGPEEELEYVEIGYGIGEAYQNNGYATEASKTMVAWGLQRLRELGAEPIIQGRAEHENRPSRRVLEKAGFVFIRREEYVSIYERGDRD